MSTSCRAHQWTVESGTPESAAARSAGYAPRGNLTRERYSTWQRLWPAPAPHVSAPPEIVAGVASRTNRTTRAITRARVGPEFLGALHAAANVATAAWVARVSRRAV